MNKTSPGNTRQRRLLSMGRDGFATLCLSTLVVAGTGGFSLLCCLWHVIAVARRTPANLAEDGCRVVLGVCLNGNGDVPGDFEVRLTRILDLRPGPVLLLGGYTNPSAPYSEADAGKKWLVARGVPAPLIEIEDGSRHTLENLQEVRARLANAQTLAMMITNRYHLARTSMMARHLHITHSLCAAEDRFAWSILTTGKLLLEAVFIHWYQVGRVTARLLRHQGMLQRIT